MESRLPLRSLQGISNAATEQSPIVGILRTQLGLIRKSDPLTESQRHARSRLLKDRTTICGRIEALSLLIATLEVLRTHAAGFDEFRSNPLENFRREIPCPFEEANRNLLAAARDVFSCLEKSSAFEGENVVSEIEKRLREMLIRGFLNRSSYGVEGGAPDLNSTKLEEWMATLSGEPTDRDAVHGVLAAIDLFVSSLIGDGGGLTRRVLALERERLNIDHQLNQINNQAEVNREKLFSGFQQIAKSLAHADSQKRFCANRFDNPVTEGFYSSR